MLGYGSMRCASQPVQCRREECAGGNDGRYLQPLKVCGCVGGTTVGAEEHKESDVLIKQMAGSIPKESIYPCHEEAKFTQREVNLHVRSAR